MDIESVSSLFPSGGVLCAAAVQSGVFGIGRVDLKNSASTDHSHGLGLLDIKYVSVLKPRDTWFGNSSGIALHLQSATSHNR